MTERNKQPFRIFGRDQQVMYRSSVNPNLNHDAAQLPG